MESNPGQLANLARREQNCALLGYLRIQFVVAALLCASMVGQQPNRGVIGVMFDVKQRAPGVTVRHVASGGPAELAGLRAGDVIVQVDELVALPEGLSQYIASKPPEARVTLLYLRGGRRFTATVTLGEPRAVYQRAATLNDPEGQVVLGRIHLENKNQLEACQWFRRAAEAGNAQGQVALAWCYESGNAGQPKEDALAAYWYRRAAEQGDASGQAGLARAYGKGAGVPRNDQEAIRWARLSADQGSPGAMALLGELNRIGAGMPADPAEAARWFLRARLAATPQDADLRKFVEQQLSEILSSAKLTRAQLDSIERAEVERANAAADAARLKTGSFHLSTRPGRTRAYVDDFFRGETGESAGEMMIDGLAPGAHRVRLTLDGYADATRTTTVTAAAVTAIDVALERAGPRPLTATEVEEALRNGVPVARVRDMVRQYGVDFALSDEVERKLRAAGADDALLLAISRAKRS
jgi:hypothetical protein